ncbi:hypothetical protein [Methylophaga sp.]|uniref:hypothetical protein n=1 Tax=Methylophaga sp. TaxID=2024840 RepID=UPI003F699E0F
MKASQAARLKLRCPITLGRDHTITIPDGWFELVFDMCARIEDIAQQINRKKRQRMFLPRIVFIEEHMGRISCDLINGNQDIADIIRKTQMTSVRRCMYCGDEANQFRHGRQLVTCCPKHRQGVMS